MSRNGVVLLPLPAGYELPPWPLPFFATFPRSAWLRMVELDLAGLYPAASAADRALTARTLAPFPLAQPGQR